jgi:hypothetical protein
MLQGKKSLEKTKEKCKNAKCQSAIKETIRDNIFE